MIDFIVCVIKHAIDKCNLAPKLSTICLKYCRHAVKVKTAVELQAQSGCTPSITYTIQCIQSLLSCEQISKVLTSDSEILP